MRRETPTAERERKFKRAKLRRVNLRRINLFDVDCRVAVVADCAYGAVGDMFAWLSAAQIRKPPREMLDAKLARQVAIHIMAGALEIPQRQIARLQGRQRTSIHFAVQAVERRLERAEFMTVYEETASQALQRANEAFEGAAQ